MLPPALALFARFRTKCTITWASTTITNPTMAYSIVLWAPLTLLDSPPEVIYLNPPTIIMTTATIPTINENILTASVRRDWKLLLPFSLPAPQLVAPPIALKSSCVPHSTPFWSWVGKAYAADDTDIGSNRSVKPATSLIRVLRNFFVIVIDRYPFLSNYLVSFIA